MASPSPVVSAQGLVKNYGAFTAVKSLDFAIEAGEIFGIIGPDGSGKTSIFHILGGVMEASGGETLVLGRKPREARLEIGYLTQQFSLYTDLSVMENLRYVAGLREVSPKLFTERAKRYLRLMDLNRFSERLAGQLSGGMKQKLALCCALIARPKLLLLDEPTTGVDPVSRREFWDVLAMVCQEGVTVAVATPYLDEAERCDRLILLHEGKIKETGTPAQLKEHLGLHRLELRTSNIDSLEPTLRILQRKQPSLICDIQAFGDKLDLLVSDSGQAKAAVELAFATEQIRTYNLSLQEPTLENVFVSILEQEKKHSQLNPEQTKIPSAKHSSASNNQPCTHPHTITTTANFPFESKEARNFFGDTTNGSAIEAIAISKTFGNFKAVDKLTLKVEYGEIYGLLGANGAGKTTTIKMLCGLIQQSAGDMALAGRTSNLRSAILRQRLGYMSQKFTLYDDLTIKENLDYYCGVYLVPHHLREERINWALTNTELTEQSHLLAGQLPGGWKQRLAFSAAVLHHPEVLFLDEPTSGVDPLARREMWRLIRQFASSGTAILVTTHFLEEAEYCNTLGFMATGKLVAQGSPSAIKAGQPGVLFELTVSDTRKAYELLQKLLPPWRTSRFASQLHVVLDDEKEHRLWLEKQLEKAELEIIQMRPLPYSLEDAFISIVQREAAV